MKFESIIGLEIHVQLKTKSKMFCGCDNSGENLPPNTVICPICLGHPGTLPVINNQALRFGVLAGLALNCQIPDSSKFDRKNYFYPDLPKGYQISQYDEPVAINGFLNIEIPAKKNERTSARIGITRLHLEEDAAKLLHSADKKTSLVDYNRAGTPLAEIVTEPDMRSPLEAKSFLQELRLMMRYLAVSDADMEKGHLRCDANISLRPLGETKLYPKTEIKNINSFRAVERALEYEIMRQTKLWEEGAPQEATTTRGWDDSRQITVLQRTKEEAHDYRYFPEPDLPPLELSEMSSRLSRELPELPAQKRERFKNEYFFSSEDARTVSEDLELSNYAEKVISELKEWLSTLPEIEGSGEEVWQKEGKKLAKLVSGWLLSKLGGLLGADGTEIKDIKITPENFAEFITMIYANKISSSAAQTVLEEMLKTGAEPEEIIEDKGLGQVSGDEELIPVVERVLAHHPEQVAEYKAGKIQVIQFLKGVVMKETHGTANPQVAEKLLKDRLA
ncbi:Asp-tRNA(Asn)/Glu-tRNA(Gln) amidotransferase subunit GatB [Candidatus Uhrbacteria bacterium]|nr:Asp-tRNA(Asn)/Glu-tRNA(Gln) amidotransferase subunit GatB [Candidatus Uhrbacteria bacterium]